MSAAAHAATPAAPHTPPPGAAEGAQPRAGGLTIKVPLRLVVGAQYPDAALSVYVKIAALALRPEGCTAKVATLADWLGMSKSAVERGLRPLIRPDAVDGLVEVPSRRRTQRGGTGTSAERYVRPLAEDELWVRIPVRAAEALSPRLLRLYALLAYATARRIPVTAAELGAMLHHHTGQRAGECLGERQARRLVDDLAATGWLTVHRREGQQGRHAYETHRHPLRTVPAAAAAEEAADTGEQLALWGAGAPAIHDGSGADLGDGSLASKEDPGIDRRDETEVGGDIRRRRGDRKWVARPVDNCRTPAVGGRDGVLRTDETPSTFRPDTGLAVQLQPPVWRVLQPVRHELAGIRPYVLRRIAAEITAQLNMVGGSEERLRDRIARRYATTDTIRDIGRWLLGASLVRHGCGNPACESGVLVPLEDGGAWRTCEVCAVNRQVAAARARREAELAEREREMAAARARRLRALEHPQPQRTAPLQQDAAAAEREAGERAPLRALPEPPAPGPRPLPPKLTYRQRERASDDEIRAAIATHGAYVALHIYGHLRTLPLLADTDLTDERTSYAQ
ncbi:hypothetical protein [Streptomyces griseosporeus]|uniref:hypothetical protein n=1 Tax=Streptomyces griseosporeus TaxID=1910 RepID=UPI0036FEB4A5